MYTICLRRKNRSCFWARCSSTLASFRKFECVLRSFFTADAITASIISKSGKSLSIIDREVISSSIDFAISTSLLQTVVIWGSAVLRRTSVLKLTFQLPKFHRVRNFSKIPLRSRNSWIIHHTIVKRSSTSLIQHATSTLEVMWRNCRIQRFSYHFTISFSCRLECTRSEYLRGRCQILWIVEYCRG